MMAKVTFAPDEAVLADLSPQRSSVLFPVLELVIITALLWMGVGLIDAHFDTVARNTFGTVYAPPSAVVAMLPQDQTLVVLLWLRRFLLVAWVWMAWRRCIKHLLFRARARMILTNQRLITMTGHLRSEVGEVPLRHIVDARHRGSDVAVYTMGARLPMVMHNVPHSRKFVRLLRKNMRTL